MARILILAGGCRGRRLAAQLVGEGHAVRVSTRTEAARAAIEETGAECWVGTPDRLATLRGALDGVALACWLLGSCAGTEQQLLALHTTRLQLFLTQAIDTTMRGFLYEARGTSTPPAALAQGERVVREIASRNAIPTATLDADPREAQAWLEQARERVAALIGA
ncbi:MAG TPA: hypothetical protein VKV16_08825 [Solirubrobacteraceae bacterium]|nr:hypothetical protein [Solirubrobacteraceae bacterium]